MPETTNDENAVFDNLFTPILRRSAIRQVRRLIEEKSAEEEPGDEWGNLLPSSFTLPFESIRGIR